MNNISKCKYIVKNTYGGTLGGFTNMAAAKECADKWQRFYDNDKMNKGTKVFIEER